MKAPGLQSHDPHAETLHVEGNLQHARGHQNIDALGPASNRLAAAWRPARQSSLRASSEAINSNAGSKLRLSSQGHRYAVSGHAATSSCGTGRCECVRGRKPQTTFYPELTAISPGLKPTRSAPPHNNRGH